MLAWAAALVGIIGIVSALTPEFANRSDFVRGVLPPGVPGAARIGGAHLRLDAHLAVALARATAPARLAARDRAVVVGLAIAHLVKGLDFEESTLSLLVVAALLRFRKRFDVPGDPLFVRPLVVTALAFGTSSALVVVLDLRGFRGDRVEDLLAAATIVLGFRALHLWLRPISERVRQSAEERRLVRRIVRTHGDDSLAFFSLRRDKSYFFSPTRKSFVAYKVVGGCALVSGDPVGDKAECRSCSPSSGASAAHVAGGSRCSACAPSSCRLRAPSGSARSRSATRPSRPAEFSLEGRPIRKVRQSVTRLRAQGYSFRVVAAADVDQNLRLELEQVSAAWRGANVERGFSMAMDDQFATGHILRDRAARRRVGGFLHLVPAPAAAAGRSGRCAAAATRRTA